MVRPRRGGVTGASMPPKVGTQVGTSAKPAPRAPAEQQRRGMDRRDGLQSRHARPAKHEPPCSGFSSTRRSLGWGCLALEVPVLMWANPGGRPPYTRVLDLRQEPHREGVVNIYYGRVSPRLSFRTRPGTRWAELGLEELKGGLEGETRGQGLMSAVLALTDSTSLDRVVDMQGGARRPSCRRAERVVGQVAPFSF